MELWIGCVAGALSDRDYLDKLARAGFVDAGIEVTRVYGVDDAREFLAAQGTELQELAVRVDGKFASRFIRATKPLGAGSAPRRRGPPAAVTATPTATATRATATGPRRPPSCCASTCCER